jgi:hypothetical protein
MPAIFPVGEFIQKFIKKYYKRIEYYSKLLLFNKKKKHWQDPYTD